MVVRAFVLSCAVLASSPALSQVSLVDFGATPAGGMPEGWTLRGTSGHASRMAAEVVRDEHCAALAYDFEEEQHSGGWLGAAGRKTCIMGCWLSIPQDYWILEVDVESDGAGHGLVVSVGEAGGREWFNYDLGRLDFTGRKTLTVDLRASWRDSAGPDGNKLLEPPLWLASINVEQAAGAPLEGTVRIFGVSAVSGDPSGLAGLSLSWYLPEGAAFVIGEDIAPHVRLDNLAAEALSGKLIWQARCMGPVEAESACPFTVGGDDACIERLNLGGARVGFYDMDLSIEAGDGRRAFRTSFAVVPTPHADPKLRIGAGESYPWFTTSEEFIDYTARLARIGASWTLAFIAFTAFDGPEGFDEAARQCDVIDQASENPIALVCILGNLPADLVDQQTNRAVCPLEEMASRFQTAQRMAGEALTGRVSHWGVLHLDWSFFPDDRDDPLPSPTYPEFIARARDALHETDPDAGFIAGLVENGVRQWPRREGLVWPEEVGFLSEAVAYAAPNGPAGAVHRAAVRLATQQTNMRLGDDLWLKGLYGQIAERTWEPGRQFAEGTARWVAEVVHGAPDAHVLYTFQPEHPERGGLLDHSGNINIAGVAFAICADLLRDAQPASEVNGDNHRGYLFTCERGTLAALWPQRITEAQTVPITARGPVEHYGAVRQYCDLPAGTTQITLQPGINLLRGDFALLVQ